ncbi:FG-GAP repeat domain-containing protein [Streptomyces kaempferi]
MAVRGHGDRRLQGAGQGGRQLGCLLQRRGGRSDITGDGRADIVSRDTSGKLWRTNGDGKGSFGPRTGITTGWQGYKALY